VCEIQKNTERWMAYTIPRLSTCTSCSQSEGAKNVHVHAKITYFEHQLTLPTPSSRGKAHIHWWIQDV